VAHQDRKSKCIFTKDL